MKDSDSLVTNKIEYQSLTGRAKEKVSCHTTLLLHLYLEVKSLNALKPEKQTTPISRTEFWDL
jgi:hypothetical protein